MSISWQTLKDARNMRGWTQAQLAESLDVAPRTIVNWERTGVPPKSEYKVRRVLGDDLAYTQFRNGQEQQGAEPFSFEEWREMVERDRQIADTFQQYQVVESESIREAADADYLWQQEQRYELAQKRIARFSEFSISDLLGEVERRTRIIQAELDEYRRRAGDTE